MSAKERWALGGTGASTIAELRAHPEPEVAQHPFLDFFGARIGALESLVGGEAGLEEGLMHCDFFLDNLLLHVRPTTFIAAGNLWKETGVQTAP